MLISALSLARVLDSFESDCLPGVRRVVLMSA